MINLPKFNNTNCTFDAQNKKINIGAISAGNGNVFIKRQNSNTINLGGTNTPVKELEKPRQMPKKDIRPSSFKETPWDIHLTAFDAADFNLQYTDLTNLEHIKIELSKQSIKTENIKTIGDEKAIIEMEQNMLEISKKEEEKGLGLWFIQMVQGVRVLGKMMNLLEEVI